MLRLRSPGYISPIDPFDMPFVRNADEVEYLGDLGRIVACVEDFRRIAIFDFVCLRRSYDRLYFIYDDTDSYRELDLECRHQRGSQHFGVLGWHSLEVFALPRRDQDGLNASEPEAWRRLKPHKALGVVNPIEFSYLSDLNQRGTELQRLMVGRIADAENSILSLRTCLRAVRVRVVERFSFDYIAMSCRSRGAILRLPMPLAMKYFLFGTPRLLDHLDVDQALALVATARLWKVGRSVLSDRS